MPGWHEATRALRESGAFQTVGIAQEQHGDRCGLFMQWKQMDFPVLVDSLNRLGVKVVPITLAIDEYGIVRHIGLQPKDLEKEFLNKDYPKPSTAALRNHASANELKTRATEQNTSQAWLAYADALILEDGDEDLDEAISSYQSAIALDRTSGVPYFRAGVAYRMRYDKPNGAVEDFRSAVEHWGLALQIDPNQYIWRRRIQQYGPRLIKPYPFYDWVREARRAILARGETPVVLRVEPGGAELAHPRREPLMATGADGEPDPLGRIERDRTMIHVDSAIVPAAVKPQGAVRVHLTFRVDRQEDVLWNNESGPMELWINPPPDWKVDPQHVRVEMPNVAQSSEIRRAEFELHLPWSADPGVTIVSAYALYYVCRGKDGACLYRRQDFVVPVSVRRKLSGE